MFVMEAADGSSALQRLRGTQPIDVVILDITIPGATSQEVFAEVRRLRPEARVLITSAHPQELAVKALGGPIRDFIRKPYRVAEVVQMIRHAV
jgi:CheY-like chemotaxis protein